MKKKTNITNISYTLKIDKNLQTLSVNKDTLIYKVDTTTILQSQDDTVRPKANKKSESSYQGITNQKDIDNFISGESDFISDLALSLVSPRLLENSRLFGYPFTWQEKNLKKEIEEDISYKPFDDYIEKDEWKVVKLDSYNKMIFDIDNEVLPVAVYFNYIMGGMTNAKYDLAKAEKILSKRNDIKFISDNHIEDIPYYNTNRYSNKCLEFMWQPTIKDYKKMWKCCNELNKQYPSTAIHTAVFKLDLLKLRAGGAVLYDGFYDSRDS